MPTAHLDEAQSAIRSLMDSVGGNSTANTVIVTARSQLRNALTREFVDSFAKVCTLEPFSPPDVFTFLRRWPFAEDRDWLPESNRIFADLRDHPALAEMCSNPLVLSMYVAYDQRHPSTAGRRPVRLPDTRHEFYETVVDELLLYRREEQKGNRPDGERTQPVGTQLLRLRRRVLGKIALEHLLREDQPANSIAWDSAVKITRGTLKAENLEEAEGKLRALAVETGIFTEERRGESLRFLHLTLCEYLAARELAESDAARQRAVIESATGVAAAGKPSRRLWEMVVFTVALVSDAIRRAALAQMEGAAFPDQLVLRAVREAQEFDSEVFRDTLTTTIDRLGHRPVDSWGADWFAEVGLVVSCLADAHRISEVQRLAELPTVDEVLKTLVGGDSTRFDRMLETYLATSPAEALELMERYDVGADVVGPQRLVKAMDQPDLVLLAVNRVLGGLGDSDKDEVWMLALAEAALTHELYAEILRQERPSPSLAARAEQALPQHRWDRTGPAAGSLYGCLLAIAAGKVASIKSGFSMGLPRLGLVASVDPSRRSWNWYGTERVTTRLAMLSFLLYLISPLLYSLGPEADFLEALHRLSPVMIPLAVAAIFLTAAGLHLRSRPDYHLYENSHLPRRDTAAKECLLNLRPNIAHGLRVDFVLLWDGQSTHLLSSGRHRPPRGLRVYTTRSRNYISRLSAGNVDIVEEEHEKQRSFLVLGALPPLGQALVALRFVGGMLYLENSNPPVAGRSRSSWHGSGNVVRMPSKKEMRSRAKRLAREGGPRPAPDGSATRGSTPSVRTPSAGATSQHADRDDVR